MKPEHLFYANIYLLVFFLAVGIGYARVWLGKMDTEERPWWKVTSIEVVFLALIGMGVTMGVGGIGILVLVWL